MATGYAIGHINANAASVGARAFVLATVEASWLICVALLPLAVAPE